MSDSVLRVGDHVRFSTALIREVHLMPMHESPMVRVSEIARASDGSKMVYMTNIPTQMCQTCRHSVIQNATDDADDPRYCEVLGILRPVTFSCASWQERE